MTSKVIPGLMLLFLVLTVLQWLRIRHTPLNERIVFVSIVSLCWILAILLCLYPNLPSPTRWVDTIFHPLGMLIDK